MLIPRGRNPEDIKVGPLHLPLPWLIPVCIFSPFAASFIVFVIYRYTVTRWHNRRAMLEQGEQKVSEDVEMQVRGFLLANQDEMEQRRL